MIMTISTNITDAKCIVTFDNMKTKWYDEWNCGLSLSKPICICTKHFFSLEEIDSDVKIGYKDYGEFL